jgi:hypothetical protein
MVRPSVADGRRTTWEPMSQPDGRISGRPILALVLAVACQAALAGCVPDVGLPATCQQPAVSFETTLSGQRLEPATFDVCRDQRVTITLDVQKDGILHLHGYDDLVGAKEVRAGQRFELVFTAAHVGQFPIALHTLNGQAELTVGTLTVHDA